MDHHLFCRICGFCDGEPHGLGDICPCCAGEISLDDWCVEVARWYRTKWIEEGAKWFSPKERPDGWDLFEQMKQIPDGYR